MALLELEMHTRASLLSQIPLVPPSAVVTHPADRSDIPFHTARIVLIAHKGSSRLLISMYSLDKFETASSIRSVSLTLPHSTTYIYPSSISFHRQRREAVRDSVLPFRRALNFTSRFAAETFSMEYTSGTFLLLRTPCSTAYSET